MYIHHYRTSTYIRTIPYLRGIYSIIISIPFPAAGSKPKLLVGRRTTIAGQLSSRASLLPYSLSGRQREPKIIQGLGMDGGQYQQLPYSPYCIHLNICLPEGVLLPKYLNSSQCQSCRHHIHDGILMFIFLVSLFPDMC